MSYYTNSNDQGTIKLTARATVSFTTVGQTIPYNVITASGHSEVNRSSFKAEDVKRLVTDSTNMAMASNSGNFQIFVDNLLQSQENISDLTVWVSTECVCHKFENSELSLISSSTNSFKVTAEMVLNMRYSYDEVDIPSEAGSNMRVLNEALQSPPEMQYQKGFTQEYESVLSEKRSSPNCEGKFPEVPLIAKYTNDERQTPSEIDSKMKVMTDDLQSHFNMQSQKGPPQKNEGRSTGTYPMRYSKEGSQSSSEKSSNLKYFKERMKRLSEMASNMRFSKEKVKSPPQITSKMNFTDEEPERSPDNALNNQYSKEQSVRPSVTDQLCRDYELDRSCSSHSPGKSSKEPCVYLSRKSSEELRLNCKSEQRRINYLSNDEDSQSSTKTEDSENSLKDFEKCDLNVQFAEKSPQDSKTREISVKNKIKLENLINPNVRVKVRTRINKKLNCETFIKNLNGKVDVENRADPKNCKISEKVGKNSCEVNYEFNRKNILI